MDQPQRRTEQLAPDVTGIDTWPDAEILAVLLAGHRRAVAAAGDAFPMIAQAAGAMAETLNRGGAVFYAGAGTSIRIGVQDGSELPETFGVDEGRIGFLIAGGRDAMFETAGPLEDDITAAEKDADACAPGDLMIAIAASGSTPYTLAAAQRAKAKGATVVAVVNNWGTPLAALADIGIVLDTGPEVIAGSTRMAAGTAQKIALNLISTLANIKRGAVHDGMMVGVRASNAKLKSRAIGIVERISGTDAATAGRALMSAAGDIKSAVLLCAGAEDDAHARHLLHAASGNLRDALARLRQA